MVIGKKGVYVIKVMLLFTFSKEHSFSVKEISGRLGISEKVLEQVLLSLTRAKLLLSKRGPGGGYTLARDISELSIKELLGITGNYLEGMPVDQKRKKWLIDDVVCGIERGVEENLSGFLGRLKIKDLVAGMNEKIAKTRLSYII